MLEASAKVLLTVVSAPAGYGKTTLLSQWYDQLMKKHHSTAWVTLDEIDNKTSRILSYLIAAIEKAHADIGRQISRKFNMGVDLRPEVAIPVIVNEVEKVNVELFVFIEDLHLLSNKPALEMFDALLKSASENMHFICSCREVPNLGLGRLRMQRSLLEITAADLQFAPDEAEEFFNSEGDLCLSNKSIQSLTEKTGGWAAGLQLAAISLKGQQNQDEYIESFTGTNMNVGDVLTREVLDRQPAEIVQFLMETSILSTLDADLCNLLAGRSDSIKILRQLEAANFFLLPVDDVGKYYKYHQLLSDFLSNKLLETDPGKFSELHLMAGQTYRRRGYPHRAVDHIIKSGNLNLSGDYLDELSEDLIRMGHGQTMISFAEMLPHEIRIKLPRLQLNCAYANTLEWQFDEAKKLVREVRQGLADKTISIHWEKRGVDFDQLYADLIHRDSQLALLCDDMPKAGQLCMEWLKINDESPSFEHSVVETSLIFANREQYSLDGLENAPRIRKTFEQKNHAWATIWHDSIIGSCMEFAGRLKEAGELYRKALDTAREVAGENSPLASMPGLLLARLLYEQNLISESRQLVDKYLELSGATGIVDQLVAGYSTAIRIALLENQKTSEVDRIFERGLQIAREREFERLHMAILSLRVKDYIEKGAIRDASKILKSADLIGDSSHYFPKAGVTSINELQTVCWSRLAIAQNKISDVINLLQKWVRYAGIKGAVNSELKLSVLLARVLLLNGEQNRAVRHLRNSLQKGFQAGYKRTFIDEGKPARNLIERIFPSTSESDPEFYDYLKQLLSIFDTGIQLDTVSPSAEEHAEIIPEALSPREAEILVLVSKGLMNVQIADELGLTAGTVKWYLQQIFSKLDVNRRSRAVHRARQLGLLG